ncbi:MAG: hypothetical protein K2N13_02415 [Paraprevotella sp.]|nr:hypothetical protein [Paraprevotella sp.]
MNGKDINLLEYIRHPERLDADSLHRLRILTERYPYHQPARLLMLRNLYQMHDASFGEELRKAAVLVPDRKALFQLIENYKYVLQPVKKHVSLAERETDGEPVDRTQSLIESFLSEIPEEKEKPRRKLTIADATTDYMAYLMQCEDTGEETTEVPRLNRQDLIDEFIGQGERRIVLSQEPDEALQTPLLEDVAPEDDSEDYLTETLAKIYIKQARYEKAIEIIRKLSLKYPKKNRYFADQIRFLEKLIINNKNK